jgi:hypothetical protein
VTQRIPKLGDRYPRVRIRARNFHTAYIKIVFDARCTSPSVIGKLVVALTAQFSVRLLQARDRLIEQAHPRVRQPQFQVILGTILDSLEEEIKNGDPTGIVPRVEVLVRDSGQDFAREVVSPGIPTQITHSQANFGGRRVTSIKEHPIAFEHLLTVLGHHIGPLLVVADIGQWEPRNFEHDEEIAGILGEHGAAQIERPLWMQAAAT